MQPEGEQIRVAFTKVFGPSPQAFGSQATQIGGFSDGKPGVQWTVTRDFGDGSTVVGVNLEGMAYNDWPIATLIERELRDLALIDVVKRNPDLADVEVLWRRDYWQAKSRPEILEREILRMPLSSLASEPWRAALRVASSCLDKKKKSRGRATQTVTLPNGERVEGGVSPHLTFSTVAAVPTSYEEFFRAAKVQLQPLHQWATARAAQTVKF